MAYKDKDRQREAVRLATRRYRAKGITKGITDKSITSDIRVIPVIPPRKDRPELTKARQVSAKGFND